MKVLLGSNKLKSRICTAPSIAQCLLAIPSGNLDGRKPLWVYSTIATSFKKGTEWDVDVTEEKCLFSSHLFKLETKLSSNVSMFTKKWVYSDWWGIEPELSKSDRLSLLKVRLKGLKIFLRNNKELL